MGAPLPLAAFYLLAPETGCDAVSVSRLSARDACMAVIGNAFQLDLSDRSRAAGLLAAAGAVAAAVPAFALAFPRHYSRLPDVRAAIWGQRERWAGDAWRAAVG